MAWYFLGNVSIPSGQNLYDGVVAAYAAMPAGTTPGVPDPVPNMVNEIVFGGTSSIAVLDPVGNTVTLPVPSLSGGGRNTIDLRTFKFSGAVSGLQVAFSVI